MSTSPLRPTRSRIRPWSHRRIGAVMLVVGAVLVAACSSAASPAGLPAGDGQDRTGSGVFGGPVAVPAASAGEPAVGGTDTGGGTGGGDKVPQNDVSHPELLIIKTGNLSLEVSALDPAISAASARIASLGGYVSGSERKGDGDQATASVTYRIPAAQWDAALDGLRSIGDKILGEQTQTQDVTGAVADLGARISNLRATELALQGIMARATKIPDVLAVEQQLSDVQGQIEELTTQQQHLQGQAAYSTLTVTFGLKPPPAIVTSQQNFDPSSEVDRASASLVAVLQAVATAGIWFGIVWLPILIVLGIVAGVLAFVLRRVVPRRDGGAGPMLPPATPPEPAASEG